MTNQATKTAFMGQITKTGEKIDFYPDAVARVIVLLLL